MDWLARIAERMMLKARAEGKMQGLAGEGQPLPRRPVADTGEAAGFRIMAEAGVLPEEITIKKQIDAAQAQLADLRPGPERDALLARIADLQMRHAIAQEARRRFMKD